MTLSRVLLVLILMSGSFSLAFTVSEQPKLEKAFETIDDAYPARRYWEGGFSVLWGGFAFYRGADFLSDNRVQGSDRTLSFALLFLGATRIIDGSIRLVSSTQIEKEINTYYQNAKSSIEEKDAAERVGLEQLKQSASHEWRMRWIRTALIGGSAATYLSLYGTGQEQFSSLIWPGIALAGITLYRALVSSPEEMSWSNFQRTETSSALHEPQIEVFASSEVAYLRLAWDF